MIKVFDIENDNIVISPTIFLVKEFKELYDEDKEKGLLMFKYLYLLYHYDSPYLNIPEHEKSEQICQDLKITFSLDDDLIQAAIKKAEELYMTPTRRFYVNAKEGMEKMGEYLKTASLTAGRDGNLSAVLSALKSVGAITSQFKILEKEYKEEVSSIRGGHEPSYDE